MTTKTTVARTVRRTSVDAVEVSTIYEPLIAALGEGLYETAVLRCGTWEVVARSETEDLALLDHEKAVREALAEATAEAIEHG